MLSPRYFPARSFRGLATRLLDIFPEPDQIDGDLRVLVPSTTTRRLFGRQLQAVWPTKSLPKVSTIERFWIDAGAHLADYPQPASQLLREALMEKALWECADDYPPPFPLRPGLVRRVLGFYDTLASNHPVGPVGSSNEATDDVLTRFELEAVEALDAAEDVGAQRLVAQTRFLAASMRRYVETLRQTGKVDPIGRLEWLSHERPRASEAHLVWVGSEVASVAEIDCLRQLAGVQSLSVITHRDLPPSRWHTVMFPTLAEARSVDDANHHPSETRAEIPIWTKPASSPASRFGSGHSLEGVFVARDREESVLRITKLLKLRAGRGELPELSRIAVVVARPLPYLYLAKKVFAESGVPYRLEGRFPLAAEPYAAAIDLILEFCESGGKRDSAIALLQSPFFVFPEIGRRQLGAFTAQTARYREIGGFRRWRRLYEQKTRPVKQPSLPGMDDGQEDADVVRVLSILHQLEDRLAAILAPETRLSSKLEALGSFLDAFQKPDLAPELKGSSSGEFPIETDRLNRARLAIDEVLSEWRWVVAKSLDPALDATQFRQRLHRAIETRTFELTDGPDPAEAIYVLDPVSASYGEFDLVILAGLNDGEWPSRTERDVFYPQWFLRGFGWPSDHELLVRGRAEMLALLAHPRREIVLVRHELEEDAPTIASPFLDDAAERLEQRGLSERIETQLPVVCRSEALRRGLMAFDSPPRAGAQPGVVRGDLRVAEPISATALETYLRCPFKYYARYLLHLDEEEAVDEGLSPLERGRIVHDILHEGFRRWDEGAADDAPRPVTAENFDAAMQLFRAVAAEKLPAAERRDELHRLFGSGAKPGAVEWILRRELSQGRLRRRLLEHGFQAPIQLREGPRGESPWFVQIRGRVDRADIDHRGRLHVFDYKTGRAPAADTTLQVPLYAMCLSQELRAPIDEAAYLSLRDGRAQRREDTEDASQKLREVVGAIQEGHFEPAPFHEGLCRFCGYVACCRKEIDETLGGEDSSSPPNTRHSPSTPHTPHTR